MDVFNNYSLSYDNSNDILIKIPLSVGWIDNLILHFESRSNSFSFPLLHLYNDNKYAYFGRKINLPTNALYHYYISFKICNKEYCSDKRKLSVNFDVPDWVQGKIMYQIFVDRFKKGREKDLDIMPNRFIHNSWNEDVIIGPDKNGNWNTDYYGGDLKGIENSLSYIKSLGVSIIYLCPIVLSQSNHRYDTSDYSKIDPYVGDYSDLKSLCDKAHSMDMKIILDGVFNHTGNDSKYFNEYGNFKDLGAYESNKSIYYPFYRKFYHGGKEHFDYWWGMKNLPVCDSYSKEWQDYICGENGIIDLWFSLGIDGLRLDVADELSDDFIYKIREAVKRNKVDGFILGEVWKNPMRMNRGYLDSGKGMDSVMDYPLVDALVRYFKYSDVYKLDGIIKQIQYEYPDETINSLMNFTSTHDISRAINIFGANEFDYYAEWGWDLRNNDRFFQQNYRLSDYQYNCGKDIYKSYVFTLAFLPGILSIFYGDEVGLQGLGNLANRRPFPWNNMDNDLLSFFRNVGSIRNRESFLEKAKLNVIDINNKYFMFEREDSDAKAIISVNRTDDYLRVNYTNEYKKFNNSYSLNNSSLNELKPHGGLVLKKIKR